MAFTQDQWQALENAGFSPAQISILQDIASGSGVPAATTTTFGTVKKVAATVDAVPLTTTQTADGTYDANEQAMLNAIKADLAVIRSKLNELLANMRAADKVMA